MTETAATTGRVGEFRTPKNAFLESSGSIHNNETASKLGFKGGTVPGSVHMDQFMPMLMKIYGPSWFETGDMSLYFTQATVDREQVRVEVEPRDQRAGLLMYNRDDALICVGTASGKAPDAESEVQNRLRELRAAEPGRLRILAELALGDETRDTPLLITKEALAKSLENITEPLPIYDTGVLPPSHVVRLAHLTKPIVHQKVKSSVGLFGALEVRQFKGPLRAGVDYLGHTKVLKLTESPRTESVCYEVTVAEAATKVDVASVIFMIRFMKASSPLWASVTDA
jgi:hypothetical protein